jgi:hypothetical protein
MNKPQKQTEQTSIEKESADIIPSTVKSEVPKNQDDIQVALEALGYGGKALEGNDDFEIAFLDDDGPSVDIPPIICVGKSDSDESGNKKEGKGLLKPAFLGDDYDDIELPHRYTIRA